MNDINKMPPKCQYCPYWEICRPPYVCPDIGDKKSDLQPTCNQLTTDAISRHGVSAWLDNMGYSKLADVVMDKDRFPSAQPDGPDNLVKDSQGLAKELVNDCISRRAAIDAIKKCRNESDMPDMWYDGMSCALRCIYQLSSAQPKSYREGYQAGFKDAQPEQMRGKWEPHGYRVKAWDIEGIETWARVYKCSECGFVHTVIEDFGIYQFCPNCGADMRG